MVVQCSKMYAGGMSEIQSVMHTMAGVFDSGHFSKGFFSLLNSVWSVKLRHNTRTVGLGLLFQLTNGGTETTQNNKNKEKRKNAKRFMTHKTHKRLYHQRKVKCSNYTYAESSGKDLKRR